MPRQNEPLSVPRATQAAFDAVVQITNDVCTRHLTAEYAELSRRLTAALARKRPSPLLKGMSKSWACGVVYALGNVNFLFDPTQTPHLRARELCALFGISQSSASAKARDIMRMLRIVPLDPAWCLPSQIQHNPLAWMVTVDGIMVDARMLPRELQEQAWRAGAIPFVPDANVVQTAETSEDVASAGAVSRLDD